MGFGGLKQKLRREQLRTKPGGQLLIASLAVLLSDVEEALLLLAA